MAYNLDEIKKKILEGKTFVSLKCRWNNRENEPVDITINPKHVELIEEGESMLEEEGETTPVKYISIAMPNYVLEIDEKSCIIYERRSK